MNGLVLQAALALAVVVATVRAASASARGARARVAFVGGIQWCGSAFAVGVLGLVVGVVRVGAAETIPPAPREHFNDYAGVVSAATERELNALLVEHERATSSQIIVAVFPKMHSDSSIEDYTVRVAQAWRAGRQDRDNGAVLFAFMQDRALFLQVGYGLESAVPDATANSIIEDEIVPRFRQSDVDGGFRAGVTALLAATRGEYVGTGRTHGESGRGRSKGLPGWGIFLVVIGIWVVSRLNREGTQYTSRGRRSVLYSGNHWGGGGGGFGGGGGGGGGFSGGGGGFGGGGAGGKW